jgi:hypothetical protein
MKQKPGRTSASSIATPIGTPPPAKPPKHLSAGAAAVWREVTATRPGDYFASALPVLESYCVATAEHRRLSALLETIDPITDTNVFAQLSRLQDTHAQRIGASATKLRVAQQSQYDGRAASRAKVYTGPRPWTTTGP